MSKNSLELSLKILATEGGIDFFGIADLDTFRPDFEKVWPLPLHGLRFGISVGMALNSWIVDKLTNAPDPLTAKLYWHDCYTVVNERLDWIVLNLASEIERKGFRAVPVPATMKVDKDELLGPFTHKAVARMAGLGWIGKSCLLVTPEKGPRVRWGTVLTDAPLAPTGRPMEDGCGSCTACVKACPVQAFTGRKFRQDEPVAARYDVRKCQSHLKQALVCGLCLASCPHGKRTKSRD